MKSDNTNLIKQYLKLYLAERPLFLSLIRAVEASLYAQYIPLKGPILDIGTGDGFFAKTVFKKLDVGLDVENSRIHEAEKLGVYQKLVTYNGKIFPLKSNSFSTVVSNCVFEHIPDLPLLLSEIHRVLKPGGILLTTVMAKPWEEYLFGAKIMGNWYKRYMRKKQVHLNLLTKSEWDQQFIKAGFKIKTCTGYLDKSASRLIDICHYISLPSLISYNLTGKWVLLPTFSWYPVDFLSRIILLEVSSDVSSGIFYQLLKN